MVDDEVADPEERFLLDRAEQLEHGGHGHLPVGRRGDLVERRDGVPEAAARVAGDERERGLGRVDALAVRDPAQEPSQLGEPWPLEEERLAARADGRQHLADVGRAEDEDEVRGRFLDQLQQRVERGVGELVRLVEDVDLRASLDRLQDHALADLAHVVDPTLRRRIHLDHVERGPGSDRPAGVTDLARRRRRPLLAVERFRDDAGERRLPGAARPGEQVGLAHLVSLDRVPKRPDDGLLPDDLLEIERPVLPVERGHVVMLRAAGGCSLAEDARSRTVRRRRSRGGAYVDRSGQAAPRRLGGSA